MTRQASLSMPDFKHTASGFATTLNPARIACLTVSLAKRIKQALKDAGISKSDLARAVGVSPSAVTQWENGDTKVLDGDNLLKAARALSVSPEWLGSGKGDKTTNWSLGPDIRAKVPLISWTTAGIWNDVQDPFPPGGAEEWIETTATVSPAAFALRVVGDSMEPKIPDGSIVIIDPQAPYGHGKIVLAKRTTDQQATLKQLWYDGATPSLKPLNPRYAILEMPQDTRIIGVAVRLEQDL